MKESPKKQDRNEKTTQQTTEKKKHQDKQVDEAARESFPASDAPASYRAPDSQKAKDKRK